MAKYSVSILGFGDNVVDKYEHIKTMYPGGNCVNVCVYASMFGAERSAYMGYFGDDTEAEHVIQVLQELKIETIKCKQLHGENGCAKVFIEEDGNRIFIGSNEGGIRGKTPWILDRFDLEYIRQFDVVHSGNYCFTEQELEKIKEAGIPVAFDFSDDSTIEYFREIAPKVTYAFCSSELEGEDLKDFLKEIFDLGPEIVVATRGSKGCVLYDGQEYYIQPATPTEEVIDTMGAGDSFIASFLTGYLHRRKEGQVQEAIRASLKEASAFASRICGLEGAFGYGKKYEDA